MSEFYAQFQWACRSNARQQFDHIRDALLDPDVFESETKRKTAERMAYMIPVLVQATNGDIISQAAIRLALASDCDWGPGRAAIWRGALYGAELIAFFRTESRPIDLIAAVGEFVGWLCSRPDPEAFDIRKTMSVITLNEIHTLGQEALAAFGLVGRGWCFDSFAETWIDR